MKAASDVRLLHVPHPYKAMLAICSDLDETPDRNVYWEIARFLNTTQNTSMGPGIGLEVGNTIYFDMPPDQFAYWNTDDAGRVMVQEMIKSGHIDCLHSYGDLATTREHAGRALDELARHDCKVPVWVDHGIAVTNLGSDIMQGHGDEPGHPAYHADLTLGHGVRYVWCGRVTSVIGQEVPTSYRGIASPRHPLRSLKTIGKEAAKHLLGRIGSPKYRLQAPNRVLGERVLRDSQQVVEFIRCNPHFGGVSCCDRASQIDQVLTGSMLERLIARRGVCVLYTHLGKTGGGVVPFGPAAVRAFRTLAEQAHQQRLLVTTTSRLLRYLWIRDHLNWRTEKLASGEMLIDLSWTACGPPPAAEDLMGLSFRLDRGGYRIRYAQHELWGGRIERPAEISVMPFKKLKFPDSQRGF